MSPPGVMSFTDDQAMRAQMSGRANIRTQAITWITPLVAHQESKVAKTARYALMPAGPAGNYPGSNSHGLGIPGRRQEQGRCLGLHQLGGFQEDDRAHRQGEGLRRRLPPVGHHVRLFHQEA